MLHAPSTSRTRWTLRAQRWGLAVFLGALLGLLEIWGTVGTGYFSGWGDHFVLSPEGISWANPGSFANDWFMEVAPQPHWFFDIVTFVGASLNMLSAMYVLYWACGLLAFGAATMILAYRFVPKAPWIMGIAVVLVVSVSPWMIGGTGSPIIAQALPAVLSGNLIYLLLAAMLSERRVLVIVLAPVIAIVHVQQGSIALVLVVAMLIVEAVRNRAIDWSMALAAGLTGAFVAFGLVLRPVASNLQDFVRICDEVIPYHCAAHLWSAQELISTVGLVVLCGLSVVLVPASKRWIWLATIGLATLGYFGGFVMDALRVPFLGTLAQGVNVYRLGAVLLPFAIWGAFAPILTRAVGRRLVVISALWAAGWLAFLLAPGFSTMTGPRLVLLGLALLMPFTWYLVRRRRDVAGKPTDETKESDFRVTALVAGLLIFALSAAAGGMQVRSPNFAFIGSESLREWGAQVREVVPEGEVIVGSPRFEWIKLVTQRAVIADCKDVPYGGEAWVQWQERLNDLGGYEQCVAPGPLLYDDLSTAELIAIADKYESDFMVLNPAEIRMVEGLERAGWTHVLSPVDGAGADLMVRGE